MQYSENIKELHKKTYEQSVALTKFNEYNRTMRNSFMSLGGNGMKKRAMAAALTAAMLCGMLAGCKEKEAVYDANLPTEAVEAPIYVEAIGDMSDDFIRGVDISTVLVQEASGVVYYNEAGEEADLFQVLADAGVNYIRVRVWNDPYDENGNGYGGGNNDATKAAEIGARAAKYGMKLLVDFHYSDFWADPSKQMVPKAWANMTLEEKETALYEYTKESLTTIMKAGADVGMVQIGNEINNGMCGETQWDKIIPLMAQGSKAVREVAEKEKQEILVAVHFTDIQDGDEILNHAKRLAREELDYDVFGVSYYPFWHGTMENLTAKLKMISQIYDKKVAVLETSYVYTLEDGDGTGNTVTEATLNENYAANVQSQATCIRDVMAATVAAGENAIGVFYWEPAWIPVGPASQYTKNQKIWEEFGSGWASSYAGGYDPKDAGRYYGGSSWDNQALFDFEGHPLASLNVFKYAKYGTISKLTVDYVEETVVELNTGDELVLPETINVVYNDRSQSGPAAVTWNEADYANIDSSKVGTYKIHGALEDGTEVTCELKISGINLLKNPGFEDADISMWNVTYPGNKNQTDIQEKESDAFTGVKSFHFWDSSEVEFDVEQTVSGLEEGSYTLQAQMQGGDVGSAAEISIYAIVNGETYESDPVTLQGWINWQTPVIKDIPLDGASDIIVGAHVKCAAGGWGTIDDFNLYRQ